MILEIKNLNKKFTRGKNEFLAVNNVNLDIDEGDFISIIGPSGSGKSTLLNLISGALTPTSGDIKFNNQSIIGLEDKELSLIRNNSIGYILQGQSLLANLTVLENIKIPFYLTTHKNDVTFEENLLKLMKQTGIDHLASSYPSDLSGGESKRVAIARALINNPKIILADEPTSDLNPDNAKIIMELFQEISKQGTTIIMVTHDLESTNYSNRTYKMENGILSTI